MPFIDLDEKNNNGRYSGTPAEITLNEYECDLFIYYKHDPKIGLKAEPITIYYNGRSVTLNVDGEFANKPALYGEVYFNRFEQKTPLITVIHFEGDENRYYTHSRLHTHLLSITNRDRRIDDLPQIKNDLTKILLNENYATNKATTCQIDQTKPGYSSHIVLQTHSNSPDIGFTKLTHKPTKDTKTFILYKNNMLNAHIDGKLKHIDEIQNRSYSEIDVYFSVKIELPLLVCLKGINKECYQHTKANNKYYFKKTVKDYDALIGGQKKELIKILKDAEFILLNTVQLLIHYTSKYERSKIGSKTGKEPTDAQPESIGVDKKGDLCNQLKDLSYSCYLHDLSRIDTSNGPVELKLYISSESGNTFDPITTYKDTGMNSEESIYYFKGHSKLFVFFYYSDPRPLLICYKDSAYRPNSVTNYINKWIRVKTVATCGCNTGGTNDQLLEELHKTCLKLNPVELKERPADTTKVITYDLQTFRGNKIQIKVTSTDLNCYRRYTHEPNIDGQRLGEILNNKQIANGVTYTKDKVLLKASLFYHAYDKNHQHLLLIQLEFKGQGLNNETKYLKLKVKGGNEWTNDSINSETEDKLEQEIFRIRKELEIEFEDKKNNIFDPVECEEDKVSDWVYVIAGALPTVGLCGSGIAGYVFREAIGTFLSSLVKAA